jgi:hypothetical protein
VTDAAVVTSARASEESLLVAGSSGRLPSRHDISYAYLAGLFPIQAWALFNSLNEAPAWSLKFNVWDLIGVFSYIEAFVLLESVVVFVPLLVLAALLPARWFRCSFVASCTAIVYVSAGWFILAHIHDFTVRDWTLRQFLPWFVAFLFSQGLILVLIRNSRRLESMIVSVVDRVAVLSILYLSMTLVAVFIVLIRNV